MPSRIIPAYCGVRLDRAPGILVVGKGGRTPFTPLRETEGNRAGKTAQALLKAALLLLRDGCLPHRIAYAGIIRLNTCEHSRIERAGRGSLKALHGSQLVDLGMPLLAPNLSDLGRPSGRFEHPGPFAVLASPALLGHQGDKAGHAPLLSHRYFAFAAPDGARRRAAAVRRHIKTVLTLSAGIGHRTLPALCCL